MPSLVLRDSRRLRYVTFFYLYVMQGIPGGFAATAIYNYLIGQGLSARAVGAFAATVGFPWVVQFVWGPLIDKYQYSVIGHRKQWVVLTQLVACLASLSLLLVHDPVRQLSLLGAVFFVHSVFASIQDASVDAIAIDYVPEAERGRVNALMRAGALLGGAVGGAGLSNILHHGGFRAAVLTQSLLLLGFTVLTFFIKLERTDRLLPRLRWGGPRPAAQALAAANTAPAEEDPSLGWLFRELWRSITEKHSLRAFLIILLGYMTASLFGNAFNFHLIHSLGWSDTFMSTLQGTWVTGLMLVVLLVGGPLVDKLGAARLQRWVLLGLAVFLLSFNFLTSFWKTPAVGLSGYVFICLADPLISLAAMPLLMSFCRPRIEGSQFTTYMALVNLCTVAASYLNGWLLLITSASVIGLVCGTLMLALAVAAYRQRLAARPALVAS